jgi:hypothetical protein
MKEFAFKMGSYLPIIDACIMIGIALLFVRVCLLPFNINKEIELTFNIGMTWFFLMVCVLTFFDMFRFVVSTDGAFPIDGMYRLITGIICEFILIQTADT